MPEPPFHQSNSFSSSSSSSNSTPPNSYRHPTAALIIPPQNSGGLNSVVDIQTYSSQPTYHISRPFYNPSSSHNTNESSAIPTSITTQQPSYWLDSRSLLTSIHQPSAPPNHHTRTITPLYTTNRRTASGSRPLSNPIQPSRHSFGGSTPTSSSIMPLRSSPLATALHGSSIPPSRFALDRSSSGLSSGDGGYTRLTINNIPNSARRSSAVVHSNPPDQSLIAASSTDLFNHRRPSSGSYVNDYAHHRREPSGSRTRPSIDMARVATSTSSVPQLRNIFGLILPSGNTPTSAGSSPADLLHLPSHIASSIIHPIQPQPINIDGIPVQLLEILPVERFRPGHSRTQDHSTCLICHCDYVEGDDFRRLPCLHHFHPECIDQWLLNRVSCPVCRISVLSGIEQCELDRDQRAILTNHLNRIAAVAEARRREIEAEEHRHQEAQQNIRRSSIQISLNQGLVPLSHNPQDILQPLQASSLATSIVSPLISSVAQGPAWPMSGGSLFANTDEGVTARRQREASMTDRTDRRRVSSRRSVATVQTSTSDQRGGYRQSEASTSSSGSHQIDGAQQQQQPTETRHRRHSRRSSHREGSHPTQGETASRESIQATVPVAATVGDEEPAAPLISLLHRPEDNQRRRSTVTGATLCPHQNRRPRRSVEEENPRDAPEASREGVLRSSTPPRRLHLSKELESSGQGERAEAATPPQAVNKPSDQSSGAGSPTHSPLRTPRPRRGSVPARSRSRNVASCSADPPTHRSRHYIRESAIGRICGSPSPTYRLAWEIANDLRPITSQDSSSSSSTTNWSNEQQTTALRDDARAEPQRASRRDHHKNPAVMSLVQSLEKGFSGQRQGSKARSGQEGDLAVEEPQRTDP